VAISSLVIDAMRDSLPEVVKRLASIEGVEVHGVDEETGRIVVTLEAASIDESHDIASSFIEIPHVINANLVYVSVEDELDGFGEKDEGGETGTDGR
jgi:nitrate reductase NapD